MVAQGENVGRGHRWVEYSGCAAIVGIGTTVHTARFTDRLHHHAQMLRLVDLHIARIFVRRTHTVRCLGSPDTLHMYTHRHCGCQDHSPHGSCADQHRPLDKVDRQSIAPDRASYGRRYTKTTTWYAYGAIPRITPAARTQPSWDFRARTLVLTNGDNSNAHCMIAG